MAALAKQASAENERYVYHGIPKEFSSRNMSAIAPGALVAPLPLGTKHIGQLKGLLGDAYDAKKSRILLPA